MDVIKLVARARAIVETPRSEWPTIAAEPATVAGIYTDYVLILAAVPAICGFLKRSVLGIGVPFFGTYHLSIGAGLAGMVLSYVLSLIAVYVVALIIDALAPTFGSQKSNIQALKTVAYAFTASWVAGLGQVVPWFGVLIVLTGAVYSVYLVYLGLPHTMKCPTDRAAGYTAVTVVIAVVCTWLIGMAVGSVVGVGGMLGGASSGAGPLHEIGSFEKDIALAKMQAMDRQAGEATKQMQAAQKAGDAKAQAEAAGQMVAAALGSSQIEALAPDRIKSFVPDSLAGLKRTDFSAERNKAMGVRVSQAHGSYSDSSGRSLRLEIVDMGSMKGPLAFAGWAAGDMERQTDFGYEKTTTQAGRLVHEKWSSRDNTGEYSLIVGERFSVKLAGHAKDIDELKSIVAELDLAGLEALKNDGVKAH